MTRDLVLIGGGSGSFNLLTGLRECSVSLHSIVTMMDSGGDSGELRDAFGVLPPGDLRRCLVALSEESQLLRDLFSYRFEEAPLRGRNFGNLFILALTRTLGSEREAVEAIARILKIRGRVLPVTWDHAHLNAELENGDVIRGEAAIDRRGRPGQADPAADPDVPLRRVYLEPEATANPDAVDVIANSDVIVLAPGDLFTSTVPNLLVSGIPCAIQESTAPLVYVANLMTKHGETDGWTASRHVQEIVRYAGRIPDALLVHDGRLPDGLLRKYELEKARPVEIDLEPLQRLGVQTVWRRNVVSTSSLARHDPARTAKALLELIESICSEGTLGVSERPR